MSTPLGQAIEEARASLAMIGDGDWTPQDTACARLVEAASLVEATVLWGTALTHDGGETFIDPRPHSGGEAAARAADGEVRGIFTVIAVHRYMPGATGWVRA